MGQDRCGLGQVWAGTGVGWWKQDLPWDEADTGWSKGKHWVHAGNSLALVVSGLMFRQSLLNVI